MTKLFGATHVATSDNSRGTWFSFVKAFTLAEVLITLGIIGVVAAMTIPMLVENGMQKARISMFKETASILNQATTSILAEESSFKGICETNNSNCIRDKFAQYIKTTKLCNGNNIYGECWVKKDEAMRLNGIKMWDFNSNHSAFVTNKGVFVDFIYADKNCNNNPWKVKKAGYCGMLMLDVNGFEKPNIIGKDIYGFYITPNGLLALGSKDTYTGDNNLDYLCGKGGDGEACSYEYLYNIKK